MNTQENIKHDSFKQYLENMYKFAVKCYEDKKNDKADEAVIANCRGFMLAYKYSIDAYETINDDSYLLRGENKDEHTRQRNNNKPGIINC